MHRQLVGKIEPRVRGLDRVDVADHVGDRHVGRGELLDESRLAREPADLQAVALLRHARPAGGADGRQRIVVNLAAGNHRDPFVEQIDEAAQNAALGLPAESEQDEIVPGENGIDELRNDGVVVADDARKERFASLQLANEVVADFLFDRA